MSNPKRKKTTGTLTVDQIREEIAKAEEDRNAERNRHSEELKHIRGRIVRIRKLCPHRFIKWRMHPDHATCSLCGLVKRPPVKKLPAKPIPKVDVDFDRGTLTFPFSNDRDYD